MYPTPEKRITKVFELLQELTGDARADMEQTENLSARKRVLARWEKELAGYIRSEYVAIKEVLRTSYNYSQEEKESLRKRLGKLTKLMVVDRSVLEGLSQGEGPVPHQAGGAFPPPSNVDPKLVGEVEDILDLAIAEHLVERQRQVPGELLSGFMARCNQPLKMALELIDSELAQSGAEYRALYERLQLKASLMLGEAVRERGEVAAERLLRDVSNRLHSSFFHHLQAFPGDLPLEQAQERSLTWAFEQLHATQSELEQESIKVSLQGELRWFQAELKALVGDRTGRWKRPPVFEKVSGQDLDPRVRRGARDGDGVYVEFYADGHLRTAISFCRGSVHGTLKVDNGVPHARYEDSANVAEFHPSGRIEEYGGRYERDVRARITFKDWVIKQVGEMLG